MADTWRCIGAVRGGSPVLSQPVLGHWGGTPPPRRPHFPARAHSSTLIAGALINTRDRAHAGGAASHKAGAWAGSPIGGGISAHHLQPGGLGPSAAVGMAAGCGLSPTGRAPPAPRCPFHAPNFPSAASIIACPLPRAGARRSPTPPRRCAATTFTGGSSLLPPPRGPPSSLRPPKEGAPRPPLSPARRRSHGGIPEGRSAGRGRGRSPRAVGAGRRGAARRGRGCR